MSRKPKKGYFVRGQFVAEGSELDLELKAELKGTDEASKTELKRESTELQKLGEALLTLSKEMRLADITALYAEVGEGRVSAQTIVQRVMQAMGVQRAIIR